MLRIFCVDCSCCCVFFEITLPQPTPKISSLRLPPKKQKNTTTPQNWFVFPFLIFVAVVDKNATSNHKNIQKKTFVQ